MELSHLPSLRAIRVIGTMCSQNIVSIGNGPGRTAAIDSGIPEKQASVQT
jgi:hypothetical protein